MNDSSLHGGLGGPPLACRLLAYYIGERNERRFISIKILVKMYRKIIKFSSYSKIVLSRISFFGFSHGFIKSNNKHIRFKQTFTSKFSKFKKGQNLSPSHISKYKDIGGFRTGRSSINDFQKKGENKFFFFFSEKPNVTLPSVNSKQENNLKSSDNNFKSPNLNKSFKYNKYNNLKMYGFDFIKKDFKDSNHKRFLGPGGAFRNRKALAKVLHGSFKGDSSFNIDNLPFIDLDGIPTNLFKENLNKRQNKSATFKQENKPVSQDIYYNTRSLKDFLNSKSNTTNSNSYLFSLSGKPKRFKSVVKNKSRHVYITPSRIDILLVRFGIFSDLFLARKAIRQGLIKIDNKTVYS